MGAAGYRIQITTDPGSFTDPMLSVGSLTNSYQPPDLLTDGIYYWRLLPVDAAGRPGISITNRSFLAAYGTQSVSGMVAILLSLENESIPTFTPTFYWTAVAGAATYVFEVSKYPNFSVPYDLAVTVNTRFTPLKAYAGGAVDYWRVAKRDRDGIQGPFSSFSSIIGDVYPAYLPAVRR
jgi:hypothetical protein